MDSCRMSIFKLISMEEQKMSTTPVDYNEPVEYAIAAIGAIALFQIVGGFLSGLPFLGMIRTFLFAFGGLGLLVMGAVLLGLAIGYQNTLHNEYYLTGVIIGAIALFFALGFIARSFLPFGTEGIVASSVNIATSPLKILGNSEGRTHRMHKHKTMKHRGKMSKR